MLAFLIVWRQKHIIQHGWFFIAESMVSLFFLHFEHHRVRHLERVREVDAVTAISLSAKGGFLFAAQDLDFSRLQVSGCFVRRKIKPIGVGHRAFLFVQEEDAIDLVAFLGEAELAVSEGIKRAGAIDGFAVHLHPLADFLHAEQGGVGQVAVGIGADVEEEVAAFGHDVAQKMDEFVSAFVGVGRDIRP